jgi:hypothetical protein
METEFSSTSFPTPCATTTRCVRGPMKSPVGVRLTRGCNFKIDQRQTDLGIKLSPPPLGDSIRLPQDLDQNIRRSLRPERTAQFLV